MKLFLRTLKRLSKAKTEIINRTDKEEFFDLVKDLTQAIRTQENPMKLFNMDKTELQIQN
jgi:hypothetical protein